MSAKVCNHGFWLTDCAICEKLAGECDYGSCTDPATLVVRYISGERRPMCGRHAERTRQVSSVHMVCA